MSNKVLDAEGLKQLLATTNYVVVKYVKVQNEFRFAEIMYGPEHKQMLKEGEVAQSAGYVLIDLYNKYVAVKGESISLKMSHDKADSVKIAAAIGVIE